jgi:hypothetical protein
MHIKKIRSNDLVDINVVPFSQEISEKKAMPNSCTNTFTNILEYNVAECTSS